MMKYLPRWADRLLETFCAPHLLEEVHGDLQELYGEWKVENEGRGGSTYGTLLSFCVLSP